MEPSSMSQQNISQHAWQPCQQWRSWMFLTSTFWQSVTKLSKPEKALKMMTRKRRSWIKSSLLVPRSAWPMWTNFSHPNILSSTSVLWRSLTTSTWSSTSLWTFKMRTLWTQWSNKLTCLCSGMSSDSPANLICLITKRRVRMTEGTVEMESTD